MITELYLIKIENIAKNKYLCLYYDNKMIDILTYNPNIPNTKLLRNLTFQLRNFNLSNTILYTNSLDFFNAMNNYDKIYPILYTNQITGLSEIYNEFRSLNIKIEYVNKYMIDIKKLSIYLRMKTLEEINTNDTFNK